MKKIKFAALIFAVSAFFGCAKKPAAKSDGGKISVVATIFPLYDWAREIAFDSENVGVELLMQNGTDLHSYQPGAKDIVKISQADVFIFVGGESDGWIKDVLKTSGKKEQISLNLMEILSENVREEEHKEGMQFSNEDAHIHEDGENDGKVHVEYDEHVWLSVQNAKIAVREIAAVLKSLDAKNAPLYGRNEEAYLEKLCGLEKTVFDFRVSPAQKTPLIFCDRFPFQYLADEFELDCYAAFAGCSAETEASFETVAFLSEKVAELNPRAVFVTESSDFKLAKTVLQGAKKPDVKIEILNSMQSVSLRQSEKDSLSYVSVMAENLKKIAENAR